MAWAGDSTALVTPGTAFVDAVELAVAKFALDIAARRHRQMYTAEMVVGFFIKTGMIVNIHGTYFLFLFVSCRTDFLGVIAARGRKSRVAEMQLWTRGLRRCDGADGSVAKI